MWMLPVHGFARRRKAHIGRNETPLILVYAGGAVKTFRLHRPAFFRFRQTVSAVLSFFDAPLCEIIKELSHCPSTAFLDSLASARYDIVRKRGKYEGFVADIEEVQKRGRACASF